MMNSLAVPEEISVERVQEELPQRLLAALERRWYDDTRLRLAFSPHAGGDVQPNTRFIQVHEVVYSRDVTAGFHLQNMQNAISSLRDGSHSLAYAVCSDGQQTRLLLGVRRAAGVGSSVIETEDYVRILNRSLRTNYPGIILSKEPLPFATYQQELLDPISQSRYLAALTGIPSLKNPEQGLFAQSVDRLVDALRGEYYTLLVLAEPIPDRLILEMIERLRRFSEEIHRLVRQSMTMSQSSSTTDGKTISQGRSMSIGLGSMLAPLFGPSIGVNTSTSLSRQSTQGAGISISQDNLNKTAQFCEQVLDHSLTRLQKGRSLGFWNVGVYLASDGHNAFLRAQSISRSLYSGQHTHFEPLRILDLSDVQADAEIRDALAHLRNPRLDVQQTGLLHPLGDEYQTLGTPLTTEEISVLVSLPHREVPGLKVSPAVDFNLNPRNAGKGDFELGSLLYRDEVLETRVKLSSKSLTRHTFVTGLTGSGKTNTCLALLANAYQNRGLKFLVIDPAKTEYRFLLNAEGLGEDLLVFTLGEERESPFRLNPFEFARGFPLLSHIDLIKAIFNAAFPMYASMPYLLEKAILAIYEERGWDVAASTNHFVDVESEDYGPFLPRLSDLYAKIDSVVAAEGYDTRLRLDITAALKARLGSLLRGGKGRMLDTQRSIPMTELLKRPVVLELRRVSDDDEKAFLMALLFTRLYEEVQCNPAGSPLRHVTLMEEAHRLLRNMPPAASAESANPRGKAIEMFTDMMAEMRTYGEGFIIVDQMPNKLIPDVIKGSNLKIVHRLLAADDRESVGNSMGLTSAQNEHLPRLALGQAIVHSEELGDACLVQIDSVEDDLAGGLKHQTPEEREFELRDTLIGRARDFRESLPVLTPSEPVILRPGCQNCLCRCLFGKVFQQDHHPAVAKLNARLDMIKECRLTWDELVSVVAEDNEIPERLHFLAVYCLLTQSNAGPAMLNAVREDVIRHMRSH